MMKHLKMVFMFFCSLCFFSAAQAKDLPNTNDCHVHQDYSCLIANSYNLYQSNPSRWESIYTAQAVKARSCGSTKDVTHFLNLWGGWTDGGLSELFWGRY